ncbi:MAG: tripartite tricarboxylate transporter TctB family protein [Dysosmobacter sp.]|uniref:tripartite tricarboxylate transporter TctB family protein n=1 Tax=Dysosmobacter sp. TaxID=2591382 RepID=UPI003D906D2F
MLKKYRDLIWGLVILAVCGVMFYETTQIRVFAAMDGLSSRFFPRIVIAVMVILGGFLTYRGVVHAKQYVSEGKEEKTGLSQGNKCVIQTLAALLLYVVLLDPVGFILSTILYLFLQMVILSSKITKKNLVVFALISVVTSVAIYFLFTKAFYLMLPAGILG